MLTLANKNSIEATNAEEHYLDKQKGKIGAHPNPPNETRWPPTAMAGGGGLLLGAGERRRGVWHTTARPRKGQGVQVKETMGREADPWWGRGLCAGDGHGS